MMSSEPRLANFVIGGTEKAGTTSVFVYLSEHPQVNASIRKETDFFRNHFTGDVDADRRAYGSCFDQEKSGAVVMEASPGYLGDAAVVAGRMHSLVPDARLLFILRDPIDRLYSFYNFHVGKLDIPPDIDFESFIERCMKFDSGRHSPQSLGLGDWFLRGPGRGRYAETLQEFYQYFPAGQVKIMFFEDLRRDAGSFMVELSHYLDIAPEFWADYEFQKANVTFSSRLRPLHKLAMWINDKAEPVLRKRPGLKRLIVNSYKSVNQLREGYDPMSPDTRERLQSYYGPSVRALGDLPGIALPDSWGGY